MCVLNMLMQKVSQMHTVVRLGNMAFHGTMRDVVMERHAHDVAGRLFAAQGTCAGGTGIPPASLGIDRECRASLEKLCEGIEPGSGRLRKCYDEQPRQAHTVMSPAGPRAISRKPLPF